MGVTIKNVHSDELGIKLLDGYTISSPRAKLIEVDVPYRSGKLDITESLSGETYYENREIVMEFVKEEYTMMQWQITYSKISNLFHGKMVRVIFDNDPTFYWEGRASVRSTKEEAFHHIEITLDSYPFKISLSSSLSNWLWDSFDFEKDVARNYKNIEINGVKELRIIGTNFAVIPTITASDALKITLEGKTHQIESGSRKYYDIQILDGEHAWVVEGNGILSIEYSEGSL